MVSITQHAQVRLQQRGIPHAVVASLLDFGRRSHDHHGGTIVYFDHRARLRLRRMVTVDTFKRMEAHLDTYAVIGSDGVIVTVGHRTQRILRH